MKVFVFFITALILLGGSVKCARILGVFPFPTSHYRLANALMKGLAEAGHDVTVMSPYEDTVPTKNGSYRNIVLTGLLEIFESAANRMISLIASQDDSFISSIQNLDFLLHVANLTLNGTNVKKLLTSNENFDVVILENFLNDALNIFATHFNAPLVLFSSVGASSFINSIVGNPSPLSYVPHVMSELPPKMSFLQRLQNVFMTTVFEIATNFYFIPKQNTILKNNFPSPPDVYDLYYNVSLVLLNSHESFANPVPLVPNMIQIGGFHVKPPKVLPKDLQDFMDNAKEGVIYFSLGSNFNSTNLSPNKRDGLLKAFSKLKEKVLWKWEDEVLPGQPPNVKIGKWLPQQDILAHPNTKLFITHGGISSMTETIYHGVPLLVIPIFGDQFTNAGRAVWNGIGLRLPYNDPTFSEEKLSTLLDELLHNPKYRENAKKRSELFHDRPLKPMDTAVYWIEYVIRHKGAPHLRVAGADLPLYQYLLLDVIAFVAAVSFFISYLIYWGIKKIILRKSTRKEKLKTN